MIKINLLNQELTKKTNQGGKMKVQFVAMMILVSFNAQAEIGASVAAKLSPAGGFEAKTSTVKGSAIMKGDEITAKNIIVPLSSLKTGIEMRDTHMKDKYLETAKFPDAEVVEASGKGGKGRAQLKIRGITREVAGTYEVKNGKEVTVKFPIKLSEFKIEGIRYMGVGVKDDAQVTVTLPLSK